MENVKLVLGTDYKRYGNSRGMQIDTLSIAVCGMDYNDILENSLDWLYQYDEYALNEYDYESDFIATLTAEQREAFITDVDGYERELEAHKEQLQQDAHGFELPVKHPLAVAMQEARDRAEHDLWNEWLYGDYREAGMLADANNRYGVEFSYDEKTDTLTADIDDETLTEWKEYGNIERKTASEAARYLVSCIEDDAIAQKNKKDARREENRKSYETRKAIEEKRAAEKEAERVRKLKG